MCQLGALDYGWLVQSVKSSSVEQEWKLASYNLILGFRNQNCTAIDGVFSSFRKIDDDDGDGDDDDEYESSLMMMRITTMIMID